MSADAARPPGALLLHGLTGSPQSLGRLPGALASAGFLTAAPVLAGHGAAVADLERTGWCDWVATAEEAYGELRARCGPLVLVGLSMGGSLACHLAAEACPRHPEVAGVVAINPFIEPPAESFREAVRGVMAAGFPRAPGIAGDIADPSAREAGYDELPLGALLSLCEGLDDLLPRLEAITCPVLILTSRADHVIPPVSSDILAARVSGPVERAWLERSYHVAPLDHDKAEIEHRTVEFAKKRAGADPDAAPAPNSRRDPAGRGEREMSELKDERGQTTLEWLVLAGVGLGTGSVLWNVAVGLFAVLVLSALMGVMLRARVPSRSWQHTRRLPSDGWASGLHGTTSCTWPGSPGWT